MIKKRFTSFQKFATVDNIKALTGKNEDEIVEVKKVNTLASTVLLKGDQGYTVQTLPQEAQYSNIRDFHWDDAQQAFVLCRKCAGVRNRIRKCCCQPWRGIGNRKSGTPLFSHLEFLPLPVRFNLRKILPLRPLHFS